ncbi:MAG: hypothetical protein U5L11_03455 [Arhodomonas sp.]|nr:hypothetical protein [Arhodomonas sp.]
MITGKLKRYYAETISLPLFPTMTQAQQDQVIAAIQEAIGE